MKTINSFRSKLLALTLALMASVSTFAYEFEYVNDFHIDGFGYKIISVNTSDDGEGYVSLIEIADCKKDVVIPKYVSYGDRGFHVTTFGMGSVVFTNDASSVVESITIPKTTSVINKNALAGCPNLKTVVIDSENPYYDSRENCNAIITTSQNPYFTPNTLIAGCKTTLIPNSVVEIGENAFYDCESLETITIPNSVTKIGKSTFNACSTLSSITLSENLTEIGNWAFADCLSLNTIICYAIEPPTISSNTFFGSNPIYNNPTIYVPAESVEAYKNAEHWKWFTKVLPIEPTSYKSQWCDTWNIFVENGSVYPPHEETYRYQLAKDTVIGDYTYTAVVSKAINDALDAPRYVAAVRFTDDRKVYIYYDNAEYLLYDFNVQEGEELEVFAGINNYTSEIKTYKCTVTGVEQYACVGCPATITLEVHNHPDDFREFYRQTQWIEGVGDINGFLNGINGYINIPGNAAEYLLCAYQGDELKYTSPLYEEYGCGDDAEQTPEDLFPTLWGLQRTSCSEYVDCQENETYLMQADEIKEINGKQYLKYGGVFLREEDSKVLIYSFPYEKDFVLYDWTLGIGDTLQILGIDPFSFPELEYTAVVDYVAFEEYDANGNRTIVKKPLGNKRVKDISTMRLLDGNEYKAWLFGYDWERGNYYVEGIGNASKYGGDYVDLVYPFEVPSCYYGERLVCVSRDGVLLYQIDDTEMERLGAECLCEIEPKWSETWCNQWNILSHGYLGPQDPLAGARTSIFWLSNNTVNRDGQEYIPLMCSSSKPDVESTNLIGELRFTEDKQVYFYYDNTEYLLYDFDVQVGDTLDIFGGIELYSYSFVEQKTYPHVITKIDTLDDGRLQITSDAIVIFEDGEVGTFEEKQQQIWIEGLGSINGIVHTGINPGIAGNPAIVMLCAYRDDECVYKTDSNDPYWIDYTQLGCVYNEGDFIEDAFPILSGLQRTVCNEYCGETEEDNSANFTYKQTFDSIFFENDKPYILCNGYLLREEDNKIFLYSQSLNKDIVLYDFTLEVGDSLPTYIKDFDGMMYSDDTLVVTDISSVTLLDGKEYKKWTFDNGMKYVEGIGMYGGRRNGNFFGLIQEVVVPCHIGTHLVCVSKNNKLLYQMDDAEMERLGAECLCEYNSGPKKDNAKNGKIGGRPTPTQWNMLEVETKEMDGTPTILRAETFSYTLENDSIVANNKTYYQLARQSTKDTAITKSFVGALHFGEDEDNRVYFLRDGVEYVLYDFTAELGDTIEIFAGINNYPHDSVYTHVVTGKDTLDNGACRMLLEVVFPDETTTATNAEKVWLAGLGSIDGIVHNAAKRTSDAHAAPAKSASSETQSSVMLCAWREDSCLYMTNHPDYDTFGCVYNQDPTAVENLTSPTSYQKIIHEGTLLILHEGKVYNVIGIQIK